MTLIPRPRGAFQALLLVALVASAVWASACSLLVREPTVRIADVRVVSLGLLAGEASVELEVENPNRFDLRLREFRYTLEVEDAADAEGWALLAADSTVTDLLVGKRDIARISVPVAFEYRAVGSAVRALLRSGQVEYRARGGVRVRGPAGEYNLPFSARGHFDPRGMGQE